MSDGVSWYCPQCYTRKSIRKKSFFDKSRLSLQKWLLLLYMWVRQYPVIDACEKANVGERTAIDIYQWLREVCSQALLNSPPMAIILGDQQTVLQIDESLFRHKPKVRKNVKIISIIKSCYTLAPLWQSNNQTNVVVWAYGHIPHTCSRLHGNGVEERCSNATPYNYSSHSSTIIHSDKWAEYRRVQAVPNVASHGVVNHSLNFVEPVTGVHTQHVESYWCHVKTKLKHMRG